MHSLSSKPLDFYKKAVACAQHYGFLTPEELEQLQKQHDPDGPKLKVEKKSEPILQAHHKKIDGVSREFEYAIKEVGSRNLSPHIRPLLFYTSNLNPEAIKGGEPLPKKLTFVLNAVGIKHSIAEALILKTALTILAELGESETYVQLNSIGDRDSSAKFVREATSHIRKHLGELPPPAQQAFKEDLFLGYSHICKKNISLPEDLPRPMEFLTSSSRKHFREVLEFLEAAEIPYIFDDQLLGHRDCYSQTLFEIKSGSDEAFDPTQDEDSEVFARGGRYDELARKYYKTPTPAVGIAFTFKLDEVKTDAAKITLPRRGKRPQVFFIHLGYAAQLKSFAIVETLRKARIHLEQSHDAQRLSDQLAYAEQFSIPYTLIMGQKEALEGNVIIRNTKSRAQQTVSVDMLPTFFKGEK